MRAEEEPLGPPASTGASFGTLGTLREVIDRAARGDTAAFRMLFDRYQQRVYRYAHARLGRPDEANDLVQEVFLSVWRALPTFTYEHEGSFPALLFRIAPRRLGDPGRQRIRHHTLPLEEAPEGHGEFQ